MLKNVFSQFYNYVSGLALWKASAGSQKRIKLTSSMHFNMRSFSKNQHGVVAIVFVVLAVPLLLVISLAVNYTMGSKLQTSLQDAADAAALAAVSPGVYSRKNTPEVQQKLSSEAAIKAFNAMVPPDSQVTSTTLVTKMEPDSLTAVFTFTGKTNMVLQAAGDGKMSLGGTATAYAGQQTDAKVDLYILVDVSQSMGTGADDATQQAMRSDPATNYCGFACHNGGASYFFDTIAYAANRGYKLRLDVVKEALGTVFQKSAELTGNSKDAVRMGLFSFSSEFYELKGLSSDIAGMRSAVAGLNILQSNNGTSLKYALGKLQGKVAASKAAGRKSVVMLVTDGVEDPGMITPGFPPGRGTSPNGLSSNVNCWSDKHTSDGGGFNVPTTQPTSVRPCVSDPPGPDWIGNAMFQPMGIDPSWCQGIKDLGVTMTTLYVQFGSLPDYSRTNKADPNRREWRYILLNQYIIPQLPQWMAACASTTNDAYVANDTASVTKAINDIFEKNVFIPIVRLTH